MSFGGIQGIVVRLYLLALPELSLSTNSAYLWGWVKRTLELMFKLIYGLQKI